MVVSRLMHLCCLIKYILARFAGLKTRIKKGNIINSAYSSNSRYFRRPTSLFLDDKEHTHIPYEDLWQSAVRCKLINVSSTALDNMWNLINQTHNDITDIDDMYANELRGVSAPVYIETESDNKIPPIRIVMWHKTSRASNATAANLQAATNATATSAGTTVYITVQSDPEVNRRIIKTRSKFYTIFDNIAVNRFFYKRFLSVIKPMLEYLHQFDDMKCTLVVSGYSMCAVMAHLVAGIFSHVFLNMDVKCHTFGSPKPGNRAFSEWFSKLVKENYRVTSVDDCVSELPLHYKWGHIEKVTLMFNNNMNINVTYKRKPWYKLLFRKHNITRRMLQRNDVRVLQSFDDYMARVWKYKYISSYILSTSSAEDVVQTPV